MSKQEPIQQEDSRLIILLIAPIASILFALLSLFEGGAWRVLTLGVSAFTGFLALFVGAVTLIFQMTRRSLNIRNIVIFAILYFIAWMVFLGSCVYSIQSAL